MAKMVLLAEFVSIGGTDISAYVTGGELAVQVETKDTTTYGSGGWKENLGGLKSGTLKIGLQQDVAAAAIDSIMWPFLGTVQTFEVRASNGVVGASNPRYTGSVVITEWNPLTGSVGDDATVSMSLPTTGAVARAIV